MGPKSKEAPKTVEPAVGAKFAYVLVGQRSSPLKIMINLNCIVQILLDSIKSQLIRKIDEKIALMKNATLVQEVATATGQPNSNGGAEVPTSEQNEEIIQKLLEFQKTIQNDNGELDLLDTTGKIALGCNQVSYRFENVSRRSPEFKMQYVSMLF